jgi:hypothetical protein
MLLSMNFGQQIVSYGHVRYNTKKQDETQVGQCKICSVYMVQNQVNWSQNGEARMPELF